MNSNQLEAVRRLVDEAARSQDLVLEDVTVTPAGRRRVLRVVVDLPDEAVGGVSLDAVAQVSTAVSAALDSSNVMGAQPYVLEVTSPGTDRPLTERRHWMRARGRLVTADLRDGSRREGRLEVVDDEGVALDPGGTIAWAALAKGRVEVEFTRPGAEDELDEEELTELDEEG